MTTYINPVKCPECGQKTYELYHEEEVLMCDACRESEEEMED
jgi:ribosomal protein S27E